MARRIIGNNYRYLLPATVILGALFMLVVDTVARNMFVQEVPIGILTAIIGAPFFLYLITKGGEVC
jgi:iron complex transport system permease protein